jgi:hypothetical protein
MIHPEARAAAASYLAVVDEYSPGLLDGLYVVGSGAIGDYRPRTSDLHVVAVTAERLEGDALSRLARAPRRAANDVTMESVR